LIGINDQVIGEISALGPTLMNAWCPLQMDLRM
jgi:hypothetical protein